MGRSARARQRLRVAKIQVRFMTEGLESLGELQNVSRAGLFVRSRDVPRPGSPIALQFRTPDERVVDVRGEVRWNAHAGANGAAPAGFGVLLFEPPREYRDFYLWAVAESEGEKGQDGEPVV